jgi:bifunctional non-homologous end joining protein LigD
MPRTNKTASAERLQFVEAVYARAVQQLPEGEDWLYEVKFDGYRCLAGRDSTGVTLWSRRDNRFTDQFPTIAKACEHVLPDRLLDGEIIALDANGHISFQPAPAPSFTSTGDSVLYVRRDHPSGPQPSSMRLTDCLA